MEIQIRKVLPIKPRKKMKEFPVFGRSMDVYTGIYMIIKILNLGILTLVARLMFLGLTMVSLCWMKLNFSAFGANTRLVDFEPKLDLVDFKLLPLIFQDLKNEGLFKMGDNAMFLYNGGREEAFNFKLSAENNVVGVLAGDEEHQSLIPRNSFDLIFTSGFHVSFEFIDRTLKVGGLLVIPLRQRPTLDFKKPSNYEILYFRWFESENVTVLAMRRIDYANVQKLSPKRRLMMNPNIEEVKKKALSKLEDVLLEPPRAASGKSRSYLKRTRYLPDLMGDSLDLASYSRRVFIDVMQGPGESKAQWFIENYPTSNLEFEMYKVIMANIEVELEDEEVVGMSEWLKENVKEEEFVVMKAEAEVVEGIIKSKAIKLVDELFLECKPKGLRLGGRKGLDMKSKNVNVRAYWECLALYGKLRDEGIAVHQWWG